MGKVSGISSTKMGKQYKKDTLVDNIICINKKSKNNLTNITVTVFLVSSFLIYLRPSDKLANILFRGYIISIKRK